MNTGGELDLTCEPGWSWAVCTFQLHTAVLKGVNEQTTIGRAAPRGGVPAVCSFTEWDRVPFLGDRSSRIETCEPDKRHWTGINCCEEANICFFLPRIAFRRTKQ